MTDDLLHLDSEDCWCGPVSEPVKRDDGTIGWVVTHQPIREAVEEVLMRVTEADAPTKTETGKQFGRADYAYTPSDQPSTWKLRLTEEPGADPTARQVGMALAAIGPGGFRGRKVDIPADALPVVKRRIFAAWRKAHPDENADQAPDMIRESATEAFAGGRTFREVMDLVEDAIEEALAAKLGVPGAISVWVRDMADGWAVYCLGQAMFRVEYTIDDAGAVTLADPQPVEAEITYVPTEPGDTDAGDDTPDDMGDMAMESVRIDGGRVIEAKDDTGTGQRVFRVRVIAYGDSKNGRRYPESVMRSSVAKYEGAKAYDHHRTADELRTSTIRGLAGSFRNVEAVTDGLDADLYLLPSATHVAEALDASLAAEAEGLPPLVGISHDVQANFRPLVTGGRRYMEATEICSVNSVDVVADPAAGGRATRMVAGGSGDLDPEETVMDPEKLLELLNGLSPEQKASAVASLGVQTSEAKVPVPTGDRTTEGTPPAEPRMKKTSATVRMLANAAVSNAHLDERLVESVIAELDEQVTESDIESAVARLQRITEGLEKAGLTPTVPDVKVTTEDADKKARRVEATLASDAARFSDPDLKGVAPYRSIKEMYIDVTGDVPRFSESISEDFNRKVLRACVDGNGTYDSAARSTESVSTSTFNLVLGDSITRRLVAEYQQPSLQTWRNVVSGTPPINDFRTQRIERWGGYGTLPTVNQGAPYQPLTTPGNEEASYAPTKRGGTEDLTLESIANDDLRMFQRIPQRLGLAAAQTLYRFVFDLLDTNVTCTYDSVALFHASHANTATNAMSQANVSAARKAMRKQAAYGDTKDVLSITPKYLLTVSDLEELAFQISTSAVAVGANAGTATGANISNLPNIHQGLQPVTVDYWSSSTEWILVADPATVPTIEVGFYQGRQDPELFVQNDPTVGSVFTSDKITWKIRHIYGGTVLDHRGFYRGNV